MNTINIIKEILINNQEIEYIYIHNYPSQQLLQCVISFTENDINHFNKAMEIRDKYHLPFWDSIMLSSFYEERYSKNFFKYATHHNTKDKFLIINRDKIDEFIYNNSLINIAFNSKIILSNMETKHIPLFDFHIPVNNTNLNIIKTVLKELNIKSGYIVNSGESYHFIGNYYIDYNEYKTILYKALFFSPIIDKNWIAHQLIEESSSLRIGYKHNILPILIEKYNII